MKDELRVLAISCIAFSIGLIVISYSTSGWFDAWFMYVVGLTCGVFNKVP